MGKAHALHVEGLGSILEWGQMSGEWALISTGCSL